MCGICGIITAQHTSLNVHRIKLMCDVIAHRGPDDAGFLLANRGNRQQIQSGFEQAFTEIKFQHLNPMLPPIDSRHGLQKLHQHSWNLFFGHRRLAIIDVSSCGHQPMSDLGKNVWITYNGEIYNFPEIKQRLLKKGYRFFSETDTEIVINAYLEWGIDCISLFNGMFAFALWDKTKNQFYLVRDRYGIKPLYYTRSADGSIIFGSEVKSILAYINDVDLDYEALLEYFTFQNIFTDKTLYNNIHILPAGHYLRVDLDNPALHSNLIQYWDYNFTEPQQIKDEQEYLQEFDYLFSQAVKRQLISDVEIGCYLSGGLDSGSITAIAAQTFPHLKTFTIGFDLNSASGIELGFDERRRAEFLSYRYQTEHYEMVLKSGDMERCMPQFAWHLEEPRVGQSYPNYYASKLASKFVKVVLAGTGGDELFGGYPWRYYRAVINDDFEHYIDKYYLFWQRLLDNSELKKLFQPIWDKVSQVWTRDIFAGVFKKHSERFIRPEDYVNHSLYFEAKTFMHGLLVIEDKLSMAHSLETRVPFLDNDLVDFAMQVPVNLKLASLKNIQRINENEPGNKEEKYYLKTNDGKLLLRKALQKYIPADVAAGIKQGFSSPDSTWFKDDSIEYVKRRLLDPSNKIYELFDYHTSRQILERHINGIENKRLFIWSLLNFEEWCQQYSQSNNIFEKNENRSTTIYSRSA